MAERGRKLDHCTRQQILRLAKYTPIKQVARMAGVSKNTVKKYLKAC